MAAVLIACAATIGRGNPDASLSSVGDMSQALTPFLGTAVGNLVFGVGVLGAGMVAAIVVFLGLRLGIGRGGRIPPLAGIPSAGSTLVLRRLHRLRGGGAIAVAVWPDLVSLNVGVQVMNALMLPVVLGFLIALAVRALPKAHRLRGWYLWLVLAVSALTCALGVFGGLSGPGCYKAAVRDLPGWRGRRGSPYSGA